MRNTGLEEVNWNHDFERTINNLDIQMIPS